MLSFEPSVVFIDDKEVEVKTIIENYRNDGVGVKFFNADLFTGDEKPKTTYSDVNLIFLDLYYSEKFDSDFCTSWIQSIIPENSFYFLVMWSKDTDHESEILEGLKEINRFPSLHLSVQKQLVSNGEWNFDELSNSIKQELNKKTEFEELALWKKSIKNSSNAIIGHLSNSDGASLIQKIHKILLGHGGSFLAKENLITEKREVLFDAFDQILSSNAKSTRPVIKDEDSILKEKPQRNGEIDRKLNSWFHFNVSSNIPNDKIWPGVLAIYDNEKYRVPYSIQDDTKLAPKLKCQLNEEGVTVTDIAVVLTRPCDLAQNKFGKNVKLLSGIKLVNPKRYSKSDLDGLTGDKKKKMKAQINQLKFCSELPDSVKFYDHLHFSKDENDVAILFDFRYVFSVLEDDFKSDFENIQVLNKVLLSELQVEYSSYSSRLGITQII